MYGPADPNRPFNLAYDGPARNGPVCNGPARTVYNEPPHNEPAQSLSQHVPFHASKVPIQAHPLELWRLICVWFDPWEMHFRMSRISRSLRQASRIFMSRYAKRLQLTQLMIERLCSYYSSSQAVNVLSNAFLATPAGTCPTNPQSAGKRRRIQHVIRELKIEISPFFVSRPHLLGILSLLRDCNCPDTKKHRYSSPLRELRIYCPQEQLSSLDVARAVETRQPSSPITRRTPVSPRIAQQRNCDLPTPSSRIEVPLAFPHPGTPQSVSDDASSPVTRLGDLIQVRAPPESLPTSSFASIAETASHLGFEWESATDCEADARILRLLTKTAVDYRTELLRRRKKKRSQRSMPLLVHLAEPDIWQADQSDENRAVNGQQYLDRVAADPGATSFDVGEFEAHNGTGFADTAFAETMFAEAHFPETEFAEAGHEYAVGNEYNREFEVGPGYGGTREFGTRLIPGSELASGLEFGPGRDFDPGREFDAGRRLHPERSFDPLFDGRYRMFHRGVGDRLRSVSDWGLSAELSLRAKIWSSDVPSGQWLTRGDWTILFQWFPKLVKLSLQLSIPTKASTSIPLMGFQPPIIMPDSNWTREYKIPRTEQPETSESDLDEVRRTDLSAPKETPPAAAFPSQSGPNDSDAAAMKGPQLRELTLTHINSENCYFGDVTYPLLNLRALRLQFDEVSLQGADLSYLLLPVGPCQTPEQSWKVPASDKANSDNITMTNKVRGSNENESIRFVQELETLCITALDTDAQAQAVLILLRLLDPARGGPRVCLPNLKVLQLPCLRLASPECLPTSCPNLQCLAVSYHRSSFYFLLVELDIRLTMLLTRCLFLSAILILSSPGRSWLDEWTPPALEWTSRPSIGQSSLSRWKGCFLESVYYDSHGKRCSVDCPDIKLQAHCNAVRLGTDAFI